MHCSIYEAGSKKKKRKKERKKKKGEKKEEEEEEKREKKRKKGEKTHVYVYELVYNLSLGIHVVILSVFCYKDENTRDQALCNLRARKTCKN